MSHTKELILEIIPPINIAEKLSNVKEVEILCDLCFDTSLVSCPAPAIRPFLLILAQAHNINPLHVRAYLTPKRECSDMLKFTGLKSPTSDLITYEFFNVPFRRHRYISLWMALSLRSVVHFSDSWQSCLDLPSGDFEPITDYNVSELLDAIRKRAWSRPVATDRLYLCDIPELVLSPQELNSAIDIEEAALRKLYTDFFRSGQRKRFTARLQLVKSGFRPSFADLTEGRT